MAWSQFDGPLFDIGGANQRVKEFSTFERRLFLGESSVGGGLVCRGWFGQYGAARPGISVDHLDGVTFFFQKGGECQINVVNGFIYGMSQPQESPLRFFCFDDRELLTESYPYYCMRCGF